MEEAGVHWDQFTDHRIKDRDGNVQFRSVKDIDPADYEWFNHRRGEFVCRCGKKFDRWGDSMMHINGTHYLVKDILYPMSDEDAENALALMEKEAHGDTFEPDPDFPSSDAAENHTAELRQRRARGEAFTPDPDYYYECTCGEVFFSMAEGILHMDDNPAHVGADKFHLISGKHYGHKYVCSCGEEFETERVSMQHLSKNPKHKITKKGPQTQASH